MAHDGCVTWSATYSMLVMTALYQYYQYTGDLAFIRLHWPAALQVAAWILPLAHGVTLARALSTGTATLGPSLIHLSVLVAYTLAGSVAAYFVFRRTLTP